MAGNRPTLSPYAPRILTIEINPGRIREVIGPGGKVINKITQETGAKIDIEQDGRIHIASVDEQAARRAMQMIEEIVREVKVGEMYLGRVTRLMNFGAFVEVLPGKEGLVHISELADGRVGKVEDVGKVGDELLVKVKEIDNLGRINLTRRGIGQTGEEGETPAGGELQPAAPRSREGGPPRPPRPGGGGAGGPGPGGGGARAAADRRAEPPAGGPVESAETARPAVAGRVDSREAAAPRPETEAPDRAGKPPTAEACPLMGETMTTMTGTTEHTVLPNGIQVLTEPTPQVRTAALGIWIGAGSRYEEDRQAGISHFLEHMFFKGTATRSALDIAQAADAIGAQLNAFTDREGTVLYAQALARHLPPVCDLTADMLLHSALDPEALERERQVILEEIKMYEDSPDE